LSLIGASGGRSAFVITGVRTVVSQLEKQVLNVYFKRDARRAAPVLVLREAKRSRTPTHLTVEIAIDDAHQLGNVDFDRFVLNTIEIPFL
jgi:hypothetical protein